MDFVLANAQDEQDVKKLWRYCFTDSDEYVEYYFAKRYEYNNNYLIKEKNKIVASLMANPYKIRINDDISNTAYIVGVSSDAVDRGKGYASNLIKQTLKDRYAKDETVSMLMPIDTAIYTRYGYVNVADILEMNISIERIKIQKHKDIELKEYNKDLLNDLIKIYSKSSYKFNSCFIRDENYYKNFIDEVYLENGYIYIAYQGNEAIAYIVFYPKHKIGESGFIREIVSLSQKGYDKLFELIKSHYTQFKNIILHTDKFSYIPNYFSNDNKISYILKPFMMSRIINVKRALETLNVSENFLISIKDDIIQQNNFTFEVIGKNVEISDEISDFTLDISDFTQIYFGYSSIDDIILKNSLNLSNDVYKKIKKVFAENKNNYFNDYV